MRKSICVGVAVLSVVASRAHAVAPDSVSALTQELLEIWNRDYSGSPKPYFRNSYSSGSGHDAGALYELPPGYSAPNGQSLTPKLDRLLGRDGRTPSGVPGTNGYLKNPSMARNVDGGTGYGVGAVGKGGVSGGKPGPGPVIAGGNGHGHGGGGDGDDDDDNGDINSHGDGSSGSGGGSGNGGGHGGGSGGGHAPPPSPTPEPGTLLLSGLAIGATAGFRALRSRLKRMP